MNRRMLWVITVTAVAAATAGWVAGRSLAPDRVHAVQESPVVTAEVREQVIETRVVSRGTIQPAWVAPVPMPDGTVTSLPEPGDALDEGSVALTVDHRPVMIIEGQSVIGRDLSEGGWGVDVLALEEALQRLGYEPGTVDGRFDRETSTAIAHWYLEAGFVPMTLEPLTSTEVDLALQFIAGELDDTDQLVSVLTRRGVHVLRGDLATFPALPVVVHQVNAAVGQPAAQDGLMVASRDHEIVSVVPPSDAAAVEIGASAVVDEPGILDPVPVEVVEKSQDPEQAEAIRVLLAASEDLQPYIGASVRVSITTARSSGVVLTVPLAAVSASDQGAGVVEVLDGPRSRTVTVDLGLAADGYVEVRPRGELEPGDQVRIGERP